jgi:chromosome segregation ATPase
MKLKLLLILLIFGVISTLSLATTEPTVTEDDDRDDTQPESEEKDLEALKTKEVDSKDKLTLAEIKLKEANKPFVPSQRLIEAQENTTKATEVLEATHEKVDETNATVEENKKEFEIIRKTFDKSKKRDTMLRKKMNQLKSQLLFATAKEMEVMEAHNKTREHIEQHRIGDAKKQYAKAVKQDTMKVDNLKAREAADKSTLKELLLSIKKRLHGDDPHTQRLLQTVSDATRTIHEAATGKKIYRGKEHYETYFTSIIQIKW